MPDPAIDPTAALAPPPGWTPPQPSSPTPMDVNPATMGGTPPVMPPPTQPNVQDPSVIPNYAPSTLGATDPEIAAGHAHQTWLGHIMDVVGSILGGDQTIHVTKSPDGTMTVTHDPSTSAEKWGRVAQAALVGGAAGLANGQGPGGTARAIAAGVQAGTQQAPQQLAQANQEAAQMNAQQLAKANMALLNQKVVMGTMGMREQNIAMTDADVARANNNAAYLLANPANRRLGEIKDISELPDFAAKNADLINQHANGQIHTQTELGSDGKPHVGVYLVDQNWMNQKNDKPYTYSRLAPGKTLDDPMTLQDVTVPAGAHTNGELMATHEAEDAKIADYKIKLANADAKTDKPITNPLALQVQLEKTTDPAERSRLQAALDADQRRREQIARLSRPATAGGGIPSLGGATGGDALASLNPGDAATVKAIGEGRQAAPSRFTKEGQRIMGMVNQIYPDYDSTQFPTYQKMRNFMTSGEGGVGLNFIGTARNHLAELESTIPDNVDVPLIGSAINWAKNTATRATSPQLKAFESARSAVSSEVAKAYKGGALSQGEHDQMMDLINESDSPNALRGSIGEFRKLLNGKLASYQTQWQSAMPRGVVSPNSTIENLAAGAATPTPAATTTPSAATTTPATTTPAAAPTARELQQQAIAAGVPNDGHAWVVGGKVVGYYDKTNTYHSLGAR